MPLVSRNATAGWPIDIPVMLDDDGERTPLTGRLGWIETSIRSGNPRWSVGDRIRTIRPPLPTDDTAKLETRGTADGPYLLVELPDDGTGDLILGRQRVALRWMELPEAFPILQLGRAQAPRHELSMNASPARPQPDNAFAWWRWTLLANRLDMKPPPPPDASDVQRMLSEHLAQLWRIGFDRLARRSRGVASQCRDLLTCTCRDGRDEFAAWISDITSINELLGILLDADDEEALVDLALAWADRQIPMVVWIEQAFGEEIVVAIGNPHRTPELAQVIWRNQNSVPTGASLAPGVVTRVTLPRASQSLITKFYPEIDAQELQHLNVVVRNHVMSLAFGPKEIKAEPPGPLLGPFQPPVTMNSSRNQTPPVESPRRSTWCQIRQLSDRWELFIECRRPESGTGSRRLSSFMRSLDQLRGIEAVTVLIGPPRHERAPSRYGICIPEVGEPQIIIGPNDDAPEVHVRSYEDRWLARFVLPYHWLPDGSDSMLLSMIRTHGDNQNFETSPNRSVPWSMHVDPVHLDISTWTRSDFILPAPRRRQ